MQNTILINAIDHERGELRVAVIVDGALFNLIIENETTKITKGNIYLGTITSDVPSLEAYFVAFGSDKHGFLPYKEIGELNENNEPKKYKVGQHLLVQIDKEERGSKGAALTNQISIAGQYLVAMPFSPDARGISKNIDQDQRSEIKQKLDGLTYPSGMGIILRTAGSNRSVVDLQSDLDGLNYLWQQIQEQASKASAPALVFQEYQGIFKILRETVKDNIEQIIVDNESLLPVIKDFLAKIKPELVDYVTLHSSQVPIFTHHQIEDFIESLYSREVQLKSGGRLFIDKTEALYAIDVNSAQATSANTIEKTAYETNLEAVEHIAQLLKLRDLNGIIIIDLIDMSEDKHKAKVLESFNKFLKKDPSKIQVSEISKLGLIEVSRQRTRPSLAEAHLINCPQCSGRGFVRSTESFAYSLLHIIEQHAIHGKTSHILVQVPVEVATYLCNEKRSTLIAIEQRQGVAINVISNPHYLIPKYQIKRIRVTDASFGDPSYSHIQEPSTDINQSHYATQLNKKKNKQSPLVTFDDKQPVKRSRPKKKGGLIATILKALLGEQKQQQPTSKTNKNSNKNQRNNRRNNQGDNRRKNTSSGNKSNRRPNQKKNNNKTRVQNNRRGPNANSQNKPQAENNENKKTQRSPKANVTSDNNVNNNSNIKDSQPQKTKPTAHADKTTTSAPAVAQSKKSSPTQSTAQGANKRSSTKESEKPSKSSTSTPANKPKAEKKAEQSNTKDS